MCYANIFSVVICMTNIVYKVFLEELYKEKNCLNQDDVVQEYVNKRDYISGTELYKAFSLFQYRLSGVFTWDMTEYFIWSYENSSSNIFKGEDVKCLHILFYDDELLQNFKISDTYEFNNFKMTCCTNELLSFTQTIIDKKSLLRRELYHAAVHGTVLYSDSKYCEPFFNWRACCCIPFCYE